mgnify:CR=1 FL=1
MILKNGVVIKNPLQINKNYGIKRMMVVEILPKRSLGWRDFGAVGYKNKNARF